MVDRDPVGHWVHGSVALMGDAAHAMYPTGSNGASQAIVDARVLGAAFLAHGVGREALHAYESSLLADRSALVLRNRETGPFSVLGLVDERCGGVFDHVDDVMSQAEIAEIRAEYRAAAGLAVDAVNERATHRRRCVLNAVGFGTSALGPTGVAEQLAGNLADLDLVGTLGDPVPPMVAVDVLERHRPVVALAATGLHRLVGRVAAEPVGAVVAHRDLVGDLHVVDTFVELPRGLVDQRPQHLGLGREVGERELDRLVRRQPLAERGALIGVVDGEIDAVQTGAE